VTLRARWVTLRARWVTLRARWGMLRARWVTLRARWGMLRARWVTLRARWVTLRARWVTLRASWVTLRARWVTLRASWVTLQAKDVYRAHSILEEMKTDGLSPSVSVYNKLITACHHSGEWAAALRMYEQMKLVVQPDITTATAVIRACKKGMQTVRAPSCLCHVNSLFRARRFSNNVLEQARVLNTCL
jgi:pentatricopeptide repeat protein